jgi:hypothetical protein
MTGHADVVIAGGCETFSDVPIRLTRPIRQKLITLPKAMKKGGPLGAVRHMLKGLKGTFPWKRPPLPITPRGKSWESVATNSVPNSESPEKNKMNLPFEATGTLPKLTKAGKFHFHSRHSS